MGVEIERKFLVTDPKGFVPEGWIHIHQGYLLSDPEITIRVRLVTSDVSCDPRNARNWQGATAGFLTVKGKGSLTRTEHELEIDAKLARLALQRCQQVVKKTRWACGRWEIDEFHNVCDPETRKPLWLAEIELKSEDEAIKLPSWVGKEVTADSRYANSHLAETISDGSDIAIH